MTGTPPHRVCTARSGFAMVLVLLLISMLTVTTAALAYAVAARGLGVSSRVGVTQNRLIMAAASERILDGMAGVERLSALEDKGHLLDRFRIGEHTIEYRLWDESTKMRIRRRVGDESTPEIPAELDVTLKPSTAAGGAPVPSFEDVFAIGPDELDRFYGTISADPCVADVVTLWGDGRLNLFLASEEAIRMAFADRGAVVAESVIAARRFSRTRSLESLIEQMGLDQQDRQVAAARLTTEPTTIAMRIACHGPVIRSDGFAVIRFEGGDRQRPRIVLWRDLPAGTEGPLSDDAFRRLTVGERLSAGGAL